MKIHHLQMYLKQCSQKVLLKCRNTAAYTRNNDAPWLMTTICLAIFSFLIVRSRIRTLNLGIMSWVLCHCATVFDNLVLHLAHHILSTPKGWIISLECQTCTSLVVVDAQWVEMNQNRWNMDIIAEFTFRMKLNGIIPRDDSLPELREGRTGHRNN
jgi:hypothetical protein